MWRFVEELVYIVRVKRKSAIDWLIPEVKKTLESAIERANEFASSIDTEIYSIEKRKFKAINTAVGLSVDDKWMIIIENAKKINFKRRFRL